MTEDSSKIRNVGLFGHQSVGKTSLNEAMLFMGKAINEMGKVDDGKTISDFSDIEISRKMSIHNSLSYLEWNDHLINIVDSPGSGDFIGEVVSAFKAVDSAIFVVDAEYGVQIETIKLWRKCEIPKMVFINKMDKENADYENCLANLRQNFKDITFVPISIPIGKGKTFKGIVDLIDREARYFEDGGKKIRREKAPDNIEGLDEHFQEMIETAVESDEKLMENFFAGTKLSHEEIVSGFKKSIVSGTIIPVFCGEALMNSGVIDLLDSIVNYMPSPVSADPVIGKDKNSKEVQIKCEPEGSTTIFVFKTIMDQYSGKISYFRVRRGSVKADQELMDSTEGIKEKTGKIYKVLGKNLKETGKLIAGDLGALVKHDAVLTNDTLCDINDFVVLPYINFPQPSFFQKLTTPNKKDEEKLIAIIQRYSEEDKTFGVTFNSETHENVIFGMGELQIKLYLDQIREKNKIESILSDPTIAYRETIKKQATSEYTHKKQSGGHGQYGKVSIEIYPLETGKEYEFVNNIVGGVISKGYFPGCEKGFHEAMECGVLAGFKVVDVGIRLFDGKEHPVDSSEMAFKIASRCAFKEAMKQASPVLLEPIMELKVYMDQKFVGDILSDISSKRGRVIGQEELANNIAKIRALVPQKELIRYSIDLKSITSGTGSFEISFDSYQQVTGKIADEIIASRKAYLYQTDD